MTISNSLGKYTRIINWFITYVLLSFRNHFAMITRIWQCAIIVVICSTYTSATLSKSDKKQKKEKTKPDPEVRL